MKDLDPDADVEESVVAKDSNVGVEEYDAGNSNKSEASAEFGCVSYKSISISGVGGGCCNSTVEESSN